MRTLLDRDADFSTTARTIFGTSPRRAFIVRTTDIRLLRRLAVITVAEIKALLFKMVVTAVYTSRYVCEKGGRMLERALTGQAEVVFGLDQQEQGWRNQISASAEISNHVPEPVVADPLALNDIRKGDSFLDRHGVLPLHAFKPRSSSGGWYIFGTNT
jgi:hypothetical protein